jgi:hypothetical protein
VEGLAWPPAWVEAGVPYRLAAAAHRGPLIDASPERVLFRIPPAGRFLVERDGPVAVERAPGATDADIGCFLGGPVGTAALLLRGTLTLRAAAVSIRGTGVLICGSAAAGKSTLAAALAQRGHAILADRVGLAAGGALHPVDPYPQLWPDVVSRLGLDPDAGSTVRPALDRRTYAVGLPAGPAPLRLVLLLSAATAGGLHVRELHDATSRLGGLLGREWHARLIEPLGRAADRFRWLAGIASANVVEVSGQFATPPDEVAVRVEGLVR